MFKPINEVLLPPFLSDIVEMLCATVNVTVGGQTGVYFSEPFTLCTDTINLIEFSPSESRLLTPSHVWRLKELFAFKKVQSCLYSGTKSKLGVVGMLRH